MPPLRRACRLAAVAVAATLLLACSGGSSGGSDWRRIGASAHLIGDDLPAGWVVASATLRPGRPSEDWVYRADVYEDSHTDTMLAVTASLFIPPEGAGDLGPGSPPGDPVDLDTDELLFLAYSGVHPSEGASARRISWRSGYVTLSVIRAAAGQADDRLLRDVAREVATVDDLDFEPSDVATQAGFALVATLTDTEDVEDYGITWMQRDDAGRTRDEALDARDGAPYISLNVGAAMYLPLYVRDHGLPDDPDEAEVQVDGDSMELMFARDGVPVTVGGTGVDPETLHAFARSLRDLPFDAWKDELGPRLLIDEPEPR
jgi:hypothetical protein